MEELGMEAVNSMPLWVNVFLAIVAGLGGWEAIKYLISLGANRRKDKAEAAQEETTAAQQQAELVRHQIETSNQMLEQMKQHNAYLGEQISTYQQEKIEDRKLKQEYRYRIEELERKTDGLQTAFNREVAKKRDAERHYCATEKCQHRVPKMGDYATDTADINAILDPPRDKRTGRFVSRKTIN